MNKRLPITFISMLMLISLVCVGFSAWVIEDSLSNVNGEANGSIEVDDIISDTSPYIQTTEKMFYYYDDSFLNIEKDELGNVTSITQTDTGYITINVEVDTANIPNYTNAKLSLTFSQTNTSVDNLLSNTYLKNIYVNSKSGTTMEVTYKDHAINATYSLSTISTNYTIYIEFNVSNTDTVYFSNLLDNNISFSYILSIEGDENA